MIRDAELERRTRRLLLRPLRAGDYRAWKIGLLEQNAPRNRFDPGVPSAARLTQEAFRGIVAADRVARRADETYRFAIFLRRTGEYLGTVALMDVNRGVFQNAYLGWLLLNQFWGEGYAREAAEACVRTAFSTLRLHRVEAGIAPDNRRSIALAKSLGMRFEGLSRRRLFLHGRWEDMRCYALTSEDRGLDYGKEERLRALEIRVAARKRASGPPGRRSRHRLIPKRP